MNLKLINDDCMNVMRDYPDNYFDLAIVDPPYGIGNWIPQYGKAKGKNAEKLKVDWNESAPNESYFNELQRVSKNQIIWGANYYNCFGNQGGAVVWYKGNGNPKFSSCEIASHSFYKKIDYVHINWQAGFYRERFGAQIHPCQKPTALYQWLYDNYAEKGQKILDTHLGSGSNAIAAHYAQMGEFVGVELDAGYLNAAKDRIKQETKQVDMFSVAK